MQILYDLSTLAGCATDPTRHTGIPRAVSELAVQLMASDECSVVFCALEQHDDAADYVRKSELFQKAPFVPMTSDALLRSFDKRFTPAFDSAYAATNRSGSSALGARLSLAILHRIRASLPQSRIPARYVPYIQEARVFHTPHGPIPSGLREYGNLAFVQTIYDMIPFLMPEKHIPEHIQYYKRVLESLRPSDWVVTDSQSAKNDFCDYTKFDSARVFVTYLAADSAKFHPCKNAEAVNAMRRKYGIPDGPYVLSLCTFEPRKNLTHIIRSFAALVRQQPDIPDLTLVLAGRKGWNFEAIGTEIENAASLRDRIVTTGFVEDTDLAPLYSDATAFLYLSLYEGFGLPALEAMQCGTPVVVSNTSSLPEVVGEAGIQLHPTDQEGLCQTVLDLYNKPELRAVLARQSLEQASRFSWERCAQDTIAVYDMALR